MKWFYVISILAVAALTAMPLTYLKPEKTGQYDGLIVGWDKNGKPIRKKKAVVLYDSFSSTIRSWDPATCGDTTSAGVQANIYEGLYCYHYLKRPVVVIPMLAAAMPTVSADGLTYTIKIKKGVKYARNACFGIGPDGRFKTREVKAKDFILTFKRCCDKRIRPSLPGTFVVAHIKGLLAYRKKTAKYAVTDFSRYDLPVAGLKALDDYTLRITLNKPFPQFIYVLAMHSYAPCPREAIDYWLTKSKPPSAEFRSSAMMPGTGPYMLKEFEFKSRLVMVRNPDFRPDFYPTQGAPGDRKAGLLKDAGKRVPFIDVIRWDWMPETFSAWMVFLDKRKDITGIPREAAQSVITPGKELTARWRKKHIYLIKSWSPSVYWIAFNMNDKIVGASKSLRQALCLAYDVESYIKVLFNGRGKRATNTIPSSIAGHKEIGPGPYYRFDVAAARKKVAQAKAELKAKGLLDANGEIPRLTLDMVRGDRATLYGEFHKQQFRRIGIRLKVVYNDWSTLQQKVDNNQVQMYTMGWHADYPEAENFFQLYYSKNIAKGTNSTNYSDPDFDRWYEQSRRMKASPRRMALYVKMGRKINEDVPVLLLTEPLSFALIYDWYKNVKSHPIGYGFTKYRRIDTLMRRRLGGRN